jgi:hypothetical protein
MFFDFQAMKTAPQGRLPSSNKLISLFAITSQQ